MDDDMIVDEVKEWLSPDDDGSCDWMVSSGRVKLSKDRWPASLEGSDAREV